jgi:FlaA1/EpsC-like NDP-sugar epimerase
MELGPRQQRQVQCAILRTFGSAQTRAVFWPQIQQRVIVFLSMASTEHYANDITVLRPVLDDFSTIDWAHFLDRPMFALRSCDWSNCFAGKNVLITGAGGSIGSALSVRLMGGLARTLIFLDHSEHNLRRVYERYKCRNVTLPRVEFIQADILCQQSLEEVFSRYQPEIVFHTAAMKHLPALESDPFAALKNNLLGTIRLLQVIDGSEVESFVAVSTDKAVNPTSMLGVSKRLAELFLMAIESSTRKITLRLGNVLGSSGSVVPLFLHSLQNGLPLTITDAQASRYFLTVEEATDFLIVSSNMRGSSLLLPEMGRPRRIVELAEFLRRELGHKDLNDYVNFAGLRDGEKRSEQLTYDCEFLRKTGVPRLDEVCGNSIGDQEKFADNLGRLLELVLCQDKSGVLDLLLSLVPEFVPSRTLLRYLD